MLIGKVALHLVLGGEHHKAGLQAIGVGADEVAFVEVVCMRQGKWTSAVMGGRDKSVGEVICKGEAMGWVKQIIIIIIIIIIIMLIIEVVCKGQAMGG